MPAHPIACIAASLLLWCSQSASAAPSAKETSMPSPPLLRAIEAMPPAARIPGVADAVVVEGGRLMYLSGHVPVADDGRLLPPTDLEAQLQQAFDNLERTLRHAGATPAQLVRITIYVRDLEPGHLPAIRAIRDRFIDPLHPPASALIGVAALFHPDVRVEVDAVAVLPPLG